MEKQTKNNSSLNGAKIEELALKYGLSKRLIRQCIDGENTSPTAKTVKEEYEKLTEKVNKVFPLISSPSNK